jgi:hypothetical protein
MKLLTLVFVFHFGIIGDHIELLLLIKFDLDLEALLAE